MIAVKESQGANRSVNTGANSSAQCFDVEVDTLSGPSAFLLLCCSLSHLVLLTSEETREWHSRVGRGELTDISVEL